MKRCLVVFRTPRIAGAERIGLQIARSLKPNYDITIGVTVNDHPHQLASEFPIRGIFSILFGKFDIIHTHLFFPGVLVRIRRLFGRGFHWIHTVHYCSYGGQRGRRIKKFLDEKWVFPKADRLVAVSPPVLNLIARFPQATLIENAVELPVRRGPGKAVTPGRFVLGTTAMLRDEKGVADLIGAMPRLRASYPGLILKIAGDGPLHDALSRQIESLGLSDAVYLLGYVDNISNFLKSLDGFVSPSLTESFGLALLEAMQYSLPIVATSVGAIPALLGQGTYGKLLPVGADFGYELAEALGQVLSDPMEWQTRSAAGRAFHQKRLSPGTMLKEYAALFAEPSRRGICMVCPIVTQATGGVQKQLKLQSRELNRRGYRVYVLQRGDAQFATKFGEWPHVTFLWTPNPLPHFAMDSKFLHRLRGLLFIIFGLLRVFQNRRNISVLHAHQLFSATTVGVLAKIFFGKRLVVKVTASGMLGELRELRRLPFYWLRKKTFRAIDRVIVLSREMYAEMVELGFPESKIQMVPNSVEIPSAAPLKMRVEDAPLQILYCGRLSREKSLDTLLRAVAQLKWQGINFVVNLVGGTYGGRDVTGDLKALAQKLQIAERIIFHGAIKDVGVFYRSADVFVLPSISEGMSNALLEALAFGLPCVASNIIPNQTLIEDEKNGLLFQLCDADDLARQLTRLDQDRRASGTLSQKLGEEARKSVSCFFSTESVGLKLSQIYTKLEPRVG